MKVPPTREDEDSLSVASHSSCISYECHHSMIFDELSRRADCSVSSGSSSDSENGSEGGNSEGENPRTQKMPRDDLVNKEISADHGAKGFMHRVESDLSLGDGFDKQPQDKDNRRPMRKSGSVLQMFEQRIIDREVKAGKISRTLSMQHPPRKAISFHRSSHCMNSFLSIDENSVLQNEVTCSRNADFQDWAKNKSSQNTHRSKASMMGHALLRAPSAGKAKNPKKRESSSNSKRESASLKRRESEESLKQRESGSAKNRLEALPAFGSILGDLRSLNSRTAALGNEVFRP